MTSFPMGQHYRYFWLMEAKSRFSLLRHAERSESRKSGTSGVEAPRKVFEIILSGATCFDFGLRILIGCLPFAQHDVLPNNSRSKSFVLSRAVFAQSDSTPSP